ncbi:helix-turn-helix transcriptional regulator [bacterium]|nr:helix-turn-helix transcriptional regulator [bacterium]
MNKEYLQKFAKNLKRIRKIKHIKQDDFLDIEGISRSTISMVETARTDITLSKLKIIADVIGVTPSELLNFE